MPHFSNTPYTVGPSASLSLDAVRVRASGLGRRAAACSIPLRVSALLLPLSLSQSPSTLRTLILAYSVSVYPSHRYL